MIYNFIPWVLRAPTGKRKNQSWQKLPSLALGTCQTAINHHCSMNFTHDDVIKAINTWSLCSVINCREIKGKTEIEYNGERHVYPHWLAVAKINQIGAGE